MESKNVRLNGFFLRGVLVSASFHTFFHEKHSLGIKSADFCSKHSCGPIELHQLQYVRPFQWIGANNDVYVGSRSANTGIYTVFAHYLFIFDSILSIIMNLNTSLGSCLHI